MTQGIAFFDFDDTLARGDSILPFLLYCIRKRISPRRQLVKAVGAFLYWKLRPSRASRAKSATLSFLKGRSADKMLDVARAFFRDEYLPRHDGAGEPRSAGKSEKSAFAPAAGRHCRPLDLT